jgi:hypothetical protein
MEEEYVKCESGSESDSLNTELAHVEAHFENRFHPTSNINVFGKVSCTAFNV